VIAQVFRLLIGVETSLIKHEIRQQMSATTFDLVCRITRYAKLAAAQQTPPHVLSLRPHPEAVEIAVAAVEQVGRSYISTGYLGVKLIELWLAETILSQKNCLIPILPLLPPVVSKPQKYSEPRPSLFRT
jgi:hypothetical protein